MRDIVKMAKSVMNASKCFECEYGECYKDKKLEKVHCLDRDKHYIYGQYIAPCEYFKAKDKEK